MPWVRFSRMEEFLRQSGLSRIADKCPEYKVKPGLPHLLGCDIERCSGCGCQLISCGCDHPHDPLFSRWTGFWPGELECLGLGMLTLWKPDSHNPVLADKLCRGRLSADLNRFLSEGWHRRLFVKPAAVPQNRRLLT
jgi:hypothetical protein